MSSLPSPSAADSHRPTDAVAHPAHNTRSGQAKSGTSIFMDFTARQLHSPNSVVQSTWDKTTTHIKHAQEHGPFR
uniref:Uncharacterized protein n=1 Tax=Oryza barthii TaxID=65489 RepID=A0A0D3HNF0_9ORYZ